MWFWLSLLAAILWGIDYALTGQVLKWLSFPTLIAIQLFFTTILMFAIAFFSGSWKRDLTLLFSSRAMVVSVGIITLCFALANMMITISIQEKGASVASLIEISYPFFVVLITWFVFKDASVSAPTFVGGLLVFSGIATIYLANH
jgi:drug/metabolite transporter (DMT)-like permease